MCIGLIWIDAELKHFYKKHMPHQSYGNYTKYLKLICKLAVAACIVAENCCNYAMFSLDYTGNVVETILWTVSLGLVTPYACYIHYKVIRIKRQLADNTHILIFTGATALAGLVFTVVLVFEHIPSQVNLLFES
jgi:hypothetical protein